MRMCFQRKAMGFPGFWVLGGIPMSTVSVYVYSIEHGLFSAEYFVIEKTFSETVSRLSHEYMEFHNSAREPSIYINSTEFYYDDENWPIPYQV